MAISSTDEPPLLTKLVDKRFHHFIAGADLTKVGAYRYRCPMCGKIDFNDDNFGMCCTGPNPALHEHEMTDMLQEGIEDIGTHPRIYLP